MVSITATEKEWTSPAEFSKQGYVSESGVLRMMIWRTYGTIKTAECIQ
jgi:hypothetical protein